MRITFNEERQLFRLRADKAEYAFTAKTGRLTSLHFGKRLNGDEDYDEILADRARMNPSSHGYSFSEYRSGDPFDYCAPCLRVRFADGAESVRLAYKSHEISGEMLRITMKDEHYPLEVELRYKTWGELPLVGRSATIRNLGGEPITVRSALSAAMQLPEGRDWRLTHYAGDWGSEYQKNQAMLTQARVELATSCLTDAAFHQLPFFALDEEGRATETSGEVYFGVLGWSGDFRIAVETQHTQTAKATCVSGGVNDATSEIRLKGGECFETPMFTFGFSDGGFGRMSEILYDWQLDYTLPKGTSDKAHSPRPIIYNTWYPYEFNIDEQKLIDFIPKAKYIGAELFVIDDGWMKGRVNDKCGLGDWIIDEARFPHGLGCIADEVHKAGLMFGLWVEPEMVNPDSDLYRAHPDWVLSDPNRAGTLQRNQLILDMSRDEIRDWAISWLDDLIENAKLDYLKWDMNREATEIGLDWLERGVAVRYMRNIEYIWRHLNAKFPDLLLENCASGGGRADFGMAPFADRVNRSDNADPVDVMLLHEGYSTFFVPKLAGGAGNVSPSPNHINGRAAPFGFRANIGMTGSFSVGINLLKCSDSELDEIKAAVARFKELRPALQDAYVYRIASANEHPYQVLEYVKRDRSEFTVFAFGHGLRQWDKQLPRFRMRGLEPDALYASGELRMSGSALMGLGVKLPLRGDYASLVRTWRRV